MPQNHLVVFITASSEDEADLIARAAVEEKLAACANIVPSVSSIFRWEGKVEKESELLIIMKTSKDAFEPLIHRVQELHSYEIPEIIALPIIAGSKTYLDWLKEETDRPPRRRPRDRRGTFGPGF